MTPSPFQPLDHLARSGLPAIDTSAPNYFFSVNASSKRPYTSIEEDAIAAAAAASGASSSRGRPPEGYVCQRCRSAEHYFRECPHREVMPPALQGELRPQYICHRCHEPGHNIRHCPRAAPAREGSARGGRPAAAPVEASACWFCLANPATRTHLIVEIGEAAYIALARGGLTRDHLIIVPIEHIPGNDRISLLLAEEIASLQRRIAGLFAQSGETPVYFRISQSASHHWHMQCIPLATPRIDDFAAFLVAYGERKGLALVPGDDASGSAPDLQAEGAFFEIFLGATHHLTHAIPPGAFFPAQFGRQALAEFLGLAEDASDWKRVHLEHSVECAIVSSLKERLK